MQAAPQTPANAAPKRNADPMKREACIVMYVRFIDDNMRPFYSRDIDFSSDDWRRGKVAYWLTRFQKMVEEESPAGWRGRVKEAAIFNCFDGNKGDKICQYNKTSGWHIDNPLNG